ncbi:MAG: HupE/UreJ family protein, partial [Planctomycetota bacterium]
MHRNTCFFVWLTLVVIAMPASAHKPSDSYLRIDGDAPGFAAEWDIALRDLELLVGLDDDQNGEITWGEVKRKRSAIAAHALSRLDVLAGNQPIALRADEVKVTRHSDGAYAVLEVRGETAAAEGPLSLEYSLLFDIDPTHRGLVLFEREGVTSTSILSPDTARIEFDAIDARVWHVLADYVVEGVWHIWIGFDHILFLVTLLLPAVLVWRETSWDGVESLRAACGG